MTASLPLHAARRSNGRAVPSKARQREVTFSSPFDPFQLHQILMVSQQPLIQGDRQAWIMRRDKRTNETTKRHRHRGGRSREIPRSSRAFGALTTATHFLPCRSPPSECWGSMRDKEVDRHFCFLPFVLQLEHYLVDAVTVTMSSGAALRRLKKEYTVLDKERPPGVLIVRPLETNFLHAHFLLAGDVFYDTPYEGGIYHGVLQFPNNYPMKPPSVIMRTPSGRFVPDKKVRQEWSVGWARVCLL